MTRYIWIVGLLCSSFSSGQSLVLEELLLDSSITNVGPNRTHYAQFIEQFGAIPNTEPSAKWASGSFSFGGYYRLQLAEPIGIGVVAMMHFSRIGLSADSLNGVEVQRPRNTYSQLMGGPFIRIHFTPRGDFLGGYLDAGMLYANTFRSKQKFSVESPIAQREKVVRINPTSSRIWNPAYYAVLQYQHVGIFGIYRLKSLDREIALPQLEMGLRLAI